MTKVATVKEWCSHCETEVELPEVFTKHVCPNCKIEIKPCAQCETMDCGNCPLGLDSHDYVFLCNICDEMYDEHPGTCDFCATSKGIRKVHKGDMGL